MGLTHRGLAPTLTLSTPAYLLSTALLPVAAAAGAATFFIGS